MKDLLITAVGYVALGFLTGAGCALGILLVTHFI